jgi:NADH:ubiquinone oxidoreductase subunit 2 (subunit N)
MRRQGRAVETVADLAGLGRTAPAMAMWMAIFMFSMAGIPPLAGFFGNGEVSHDRLYGYTGVLLLFP